MAFSRSWTFTLEDGNHIVGTNWSNPDFWGAFTGELIVDGMVVNTFKGKQIAGWKYDASFRVGNHAGVLKNSIKVFGAKEADLFINSVLLKAGAHTVIAELRPAPAQPAISPAPPPAQFAPSSQAAPFYPVLPSNCSNCHAPISMSTANWTGPMSASCPHCGSGIEIQWKKIGE